MGRLNYPLYFNAPVRFAGDICPEHHSTLRRRYTGFAALSWRTLLQTQSIVSVKKPSRSLQGKTHDERGRANHPIGKQLPQLLQQHDVTVHLLLCRLILRPLILA